MQMRRNFRVMIAQAMSEFCFYFAYGSNLHPERLRRRVPSARVLGVTLLAGHEVHFGKRGGDGSGKCTVRATRGDEAQVPGALFSMRPAGQAQLDAAEGPDYERKSALFELGEERLTGFYYQAKVHALDESLEPFDWYRDLVVAGARFHDFPRAYVEALQRVRCRKDHDAARAAEMIALIQQLSGA